MVVENLQEEIEGILYGVKPVFAGDVFKAFKKAKTKEKEQLVNLVNHLIDYSLEAIEGGEKSAEEVVELFLAGKI
jgi:metallophosphoesterase superfamily enzyme